MNWKSSEREGERWRGEEEAFRIERKKKRNRCSPYWHRLQDTAQSKPLPICSHYFYSNQTKNVKETIWDLRSTRRLLGRIRDPGLRKYSDSKTIKSAANLSQRAPNRVVEWVHLNEIFWPFNIYWRQSENILKAGLLLHFTVYWNAMKEW